MAKKGGYNIINDLVILKEPPDSLVALRDELPYHPEIFQSAYKGSTFEECLGIIATHLGIILDGDYDAVKLCGMLHTELLKKRVTVATRLN